MTFLDYFVKSKSEISSSKPVSLLTFARGLFMHVGVTFSALLVDSCASAFSSYLHRASESIKSERFGPSQVFPRHARGHIRCPDKLELVKAS